MKTSLLLAAMTAVPSAFVLVGAQSHKPNETAKMFASTCIGCHVPPDPAFKADQAWLGQVSGTS